MSAGGRSLPRIYLRPEEMVIAEEPAVITTVLGSCISVILYCQRLQIGAICHATMPSGREQHPSKYVDQSIRYLLGCFEKRGVTQRETIVKVFGGADMFSPTRPDSKRQTIGAQNVATALTTLAQVGLQLTAKDVGGTQGRKLVFYSHTGEVYRKWVKKELLHY